MKFIISIGGLLICAGAAAAAELHPIVAVEFGYFFGATVNGKSKLKTRRNPFPMKQRIGFMD
jgi:hypothetical protein